MPLLLLLLACGPSDTPDTGRPADSGDSTVDTTDSTETASTTDDTAPPDTACDTSLSWYADHDADGHGNPREEAECGAPFAISATADDCDDDHATVYEGAEELLQSGRDDNCDGVGAAASVYDAPVWAAWNDVDYTTFADTIALPGDVTGDGAPDVLIGGKLQDAYGDWRGALSLFHGPLAPLDTSRLATEADTTLFLRANAEIEILCGPGDTDGDGTDDIVTNVYWLDATYSLYLLPGPIPAGVVELDSLDRHIWEFDESVPQPTGCATPGDRTDDGLPDFLVADSYASDRDGELYLIQGGALPTVLPEAYAVIRGDGNGIGRHLATTGDLDGDGVGDFSAMASGGDAGYLILDTPPGVSQASEIGVRVYIDEKDVYRHVTVFVAPVGDINGDGYADASFYESNAPFQLVKFGPFTAGTTVDLQRETDVWFTSDNGGATEPSLGISTPLGDWDGDGTDDLAIANQWFVPEKDRVDCDEYTVCHDGAVFLVAGPVQSGVYDLEVEADRVEDHGYGGTFGNALAGGSDLNQDGIDDLLIASNEASHVFLAFGGGRW